MHVRRGERLLLGGAVELAFIPNRLEDQGFISSVYDKDEIVVVAPPGHFAPEPASIPVETLLGERFIADTETAPLLQRELKAPRINCETSNITAILAMVEAGLGVSLLPSLALERTASRSTSATWRRPPIASSTSSGAVRQT